MTEIFTSKADWLLKVAGMKSGDVMRIHPRDGLTGRQVVDALAAQKLLWTKAGQPDWRILEHGTAMLLQRC